jgi:hypothetical protein
LFTFPKEDLKECPERGQPSGIKNTAIIGGIAKGPQIRNLAKGSSFAAEHHDPCLIFLE